jgi:hypothetical protein
MGSLLRARFAAIVSPAIRRTFNGEVSHDGHKERNFSPLKDLSLEELVPKDNFYHRLERTVDLSFVWELVRDRYASVRLRIRFISKQNRNSRRMDVLRTAVPKLINAYIGGTL